MKPLTIHTVSYPSFETINSSLAPPFSFPPWQAAYLPLTFFALKEIQNTDKTEQLLQVFGKLDPHIVILNIYFHNAQFKKLVQVPAGLVLPRACLEGSLFCSLLSILSFVLLFTTLFLLSLLIFNGS